MNNKGRKYLIIGIIVPLALLAVLALTLMDRVSMNPPGTVGNTAGNINNSGLFCEYDGRVYFSNSAMGGHLYSMNPDESNVRKLKDLNVQNILAGGKYLYFFQTGPSEDTHESSGFTSILSVNSFIRSDLNGKSTHSLTRDTVTSAQLVDNYLYLMTAGENLAFVKIKIDKSESKILADYEINPASAQNGMIYYNGTQTNHYLYGLNTATDASHEVWKGNLWYPVVEGDYVYYMDVAENYRLCRYSFSNDMVEVLTHDRVDCFNVGSGYIYYQTGGDNPQLVCMHTDGTAPIVLAEGVFTNINMTSKYVYFQFFGEEAQTYHSPLGSSSYELFTAK